MQREPVDSSMLRSAGYDPPHETLELEFTSGKVYQYFDVPQERFDDLLAADSKGRYFLDNIEPFSHFRQVPRARPRRR